MRTHGGPLANWGEDASPRSCVSPYLTWCGSFDVAKILRHHESTCPILQHCGSTTSTTIVLFWVHLATKHLKLSKQRILQQWAKKCMIMPCYDIVKPPIMYIFFLSFYLTPPNSNVRIYYFTKITQT